MYKWHILHVFLQLLLQTSVVCEITTLFVFTLYTTVDTSHIIHYPVRWHLNSFIFILSGWANV